jgi:hypothetical protein
MASSCLETVVQAIESHLVIALNEGLLAQIVVANDGQRLEVQRVVDEILPAGQLRDSCRIRVEPVPEHEVPQKALVHDPGPSSNRCLDIALNEGAELTEGQRLLLQRAFSDCKSIRLARIAGGFSGAGTFLVDATFLASNAGNRPVPFFVKLGNTGKIQKELNAYRIYAEHHIPWNLRPDFKPERTIVGVSHSVIVGSLVENSRPLWEVALEGKGPQHIRSLFEETLATLRAGKEPETFSPGSRGSVVTQLEEFCRISCIPDGRVSAAKQFGGRIFEPKSLWRKLLDLPPQEWRGAVVHGDMHGENVRVRKSDAIVIDFYHTRCGPMSADLASLEVWLAFNTVDGIWPDRKQWRELVEALYDPDAILRGVLASAAVGSKSWLVDCVGEIRRIAADSTACAEEYLRVVAVYLLRQATFESDVECREDDEFRRTFAYWLANRVVLALTDMAAHQLDVA